MSRAPGKGRRWADQNPEDWKRGPAELGPRLGGCLSALMSLALREETQQAATKERELSWLGLLPPRGSVRMAWK